KALGTGQTSTAHLGRGKGWRVVGICHSFLHISSRHLA
ncbi:hypothetical protein A2U01_0112231, partial [Trifolium medium]|nr:hypothetical protein [Trifolium medium]